jgi:hypothetical protein
MLRSGPAAARKYAEKLASRLGIIQQIANDTGGTAFYNTNGLNQAMLSAVDEGSHYYSLIYAPTDSNFNGRLRHIRFKLDRPGYHLAYRRSYYANPLPSIQDQNPAEELVDAPPDSLMSALQFGGPQAHQLIFAADTIPWALPQRPIQIKW